MKPQFAFPLAVAESAQRRAGSLHRIEIVGVGLGLAVATALGVFGRFAGLGNFPLAVDEYYFVESVRAILEHGVPAFETGGYYSRGLLPQYLTAASALLFGDNAFAYRLPSALFSLGSVPLAYIYGRRLLGAAGALALATMLLLSAWEIEFGRFARMYAPLQFFTLLFFVGIDRSSDGHDRRWAYVPHAALLMASLTHEFAILLIPFLFVPAALDVMGPRRAAPHLRMGYLLATAGTALLAHYLFGLDLRFSGVSDMWPAGYLGVGISDVLPVDDPQRGNFYPWRLPAFPFFGMADSTLLLVYVGLASGILAVAGTLRLLGRAVREEAAFAALLLLSAAFHQLLIAAVILLIMIGRHDLLEVTPERRRVQAVVALAIGIGVLWLVYAMSSTEWIADTWGAGYRVLTALVLTFFGWPDAIHSVVLPWSRHLPLIGACAAAALAYQLVTKAKGDVATWARHPATFVAAVLLVFSLRQLVYTGIRYSFAVYPFVLAVILLTAIEAATAVAVRFGADRRRGPVIGALACIGVFGISSDFHLRQITGVAGAQVRLRLGEFERYQDIWYGRLDYESPASFINERSRVQDGDRVLVVGQPPVSFYLRVSHGVYYERSEIRFYNVSRVRGTVDIWSNQRLLSTPQELRDYTRCASNVWIVRSVSPTRQAFDIDQVWRERLLRSASAHRSVDDRLEVRHLELAAEPGC